MSQIAGGGANVYIAGHSSGNWYVQWNSGGWQGNTFVQGQPLNTGAALVCVPGSINLNSNGTYTFWTKISNTSGNSTYFNLQVSNS
jgi:hypothetical protein